MTLVWCDPPRRGVWLDLLAPLQQRPRAWARVRDGYSTANKAQQAVRDLRMAAEGRCKSGGRRAAVIPEGRWEFDWGQVAPNEPTFGVWARWMGPT